MRAFSRNSQLKFSALKVKGTRFNGANLCLPDLRETNLAFIIVVHINE